MRPIPSRESPTTRPDRSRESLCCAVRNRYEFNNEYRETAEAKGLEICGTSPDGRLVEQVACTSSRFHVGVQYHPELEAEFDGWDKIEDQDIPDFKRTQPEMYKRHWPEREEK